MNWADIIGTGVVLIAICIYSYVIVKCLEPDQPE